MVTVDASAIAQSIIGVSLCGDCIGYQVGVPRAHVDHVLERIAGSARVITSVAACKACRKLTIVHRLG